MHSEVTEYAQKALDGEIAVGPHVYASCRRHLNDLKRTDIRFDVEEEQRILTFARSLTSPSYDLMHVMPWQVFMLGSLIGWRKNDGSRRFRQAYIETGKGSGKSPIVGALALFLMLDEALTAPEIYFAAVTAEQARISFDDMCDFIARDHTLNKIFAVKGGSRRNLVLFKRRELRAAKMRVLAYKRAGEGISGIRPSMWILDEYHEHPRDIMLRYLEQSFKRRDSPLGIIITNSGEHESPCWEEHERAISVARTADYGGVDNDNLFSYVCALDPGDDKEDESVWPKTNPGLPYLPEYKDIRIKMNDAVGSPSRMATNDRFVFCEWRLSTDAYLEMETFRKCVVPELSPSSERKQATMYFGIDLGISRDLTAIVCAWDFGERIEAEVAMFTPRDTLKDRAARDRVNYLDMINVPDDAPPGTLPDLQTSPGATLDMAYPARYMVKKLREFPMVRGAAADPYKMASLVKELEAFGVYSTTHPRGAGLFIVKHPQTNPIRQLRVDDTVALGMDTSMEALETEVLNETIKIKRNRLLLSAVKNARYKGIAGKNRILDQEMSRARIDALVALVQAIGFIHADRAIVAQRMAAEDAGMIMDRIQ